MVDLGRPDNFAGTEGVVELFLIGAFFRAAPSTEAQFEFLTTDVSPWLYRVRFVAIFGRATGTVGSVGITLQGLTITQSGPPWPNGGPLMANSDVLVNSGEGFHFTWNTEVSDNYSGLNSDFGRTWVGGLPLLYLPQNTTFSILLDGKAGYDGDFVLDGGHMQMERFAPGTVLGGDTAAQDLYLLPALG